MNVTFPGAALLALCLACTHTRTAANPQQEERAAANAEAEADAAEAGGAAQDGSSDAPKKGAPEQRGKSSSSPERSSNEGPAAAEHARNEKEDADDVEVSTAPGGLLKPGAEDKVREKLGLAKGAGITSAVRQFQRDHALPATGMLDHETVEKLGLSTGDVFED